MDNEKMLGGDDVDRQCGWNYCHQSDWCAIMNGMMILLVSCFSVSVSVQCENNLQDFIVDHMDIARQLIPRTLISLAM